MVPPCTTGQVTDTGVVELSLKRPITLKVCAVPDESATFEGVSSIEVSVGVAVGLLPVEETR
jgi:hypothetical protein